MAQRTVYYKPTNGKTLKENFETDYKQFRDWILVNNDHSLTKDNEGIINDELVTLLRETTVDKFEDWSQPTIDNLIFEYLLTYCDIGPGQKRFTIIGPMMSTWRYEKSNRLINDSSDKDLLTVWNFLVQGRSTKNRMNFVSPDNGNQVIGFWDFEERDFLYQRLSKLNGPATDKEGIEFVLSVLNEMKDEKSDLIFNVEK